MVSYTYTDFGETTEVQSGSIENEIRFTGGVYDEESGLYYLNARFYNPGNGRFLNPDSYRGEAADPQTLHLYAYCANNPITHIDPTGHALETVVDVMFLGMSINDFRNEPSVTNFVFMVWDGVATITPYLPGSYVAKGAKVLTKADIVDDLGKQGIYTVDAVKNVKKGATTSKVYSWKATKTIKKQTVSTLKLRNVFRSDSFSVSSVRANRHLFKNADVQKIAKELEAAGYEIIVEKSTRSTSGAYIIRIKNAGGSRTISQVQVSPGGGRHGELPYVKISTTNQGRIKIVDGPKSLYNAGDAEKATIIFTWG